MKQINFKYPWLPSAGNWKWFYHGALPDEAAFGPDQFVRHSKTRRQAEVQATNDQWRLFRRQALGLSNQRIDITQDLKQLYLLHLDERYKNLFLTHMRRLLTNGLLFAGLSAVVAGLIASMVVTPHRGNSVWTSNRLESHASWSATGAVRAGRVSPDDVEYRFDVQVQNKSNEDISLSRIVVSDRSGVKMPAEITLESTAKVIVPKGETVEILGHLWIAGSDRNDLARIYAE